MDVGGAAAIPAGIDRGEGNDATRVGPLPTTQEGLARGVEIAAVTLSGVAGIGTLRVAMPDVDASAGQRTAGRVDDLQPDSKGYALLAFGDIGTF